MDRRRYRGSFGNRAKVALRAFAELAHIDIGISGAVELKVCSEQDGGPGESVGELGVRCFMNASSSGQLKVSQFISVIPPKVTRSVMLLRSIMYWAKAWGKFGGVSLRDERR